MSTNYILMR